MRPNLFETSSEVVLLDVPTLLDKNGDAACSPATKIYNKILHQAMKVHLRKKASISKHTQKMEDFRI